VELGVRGGESTFVFERVARLCGSIMVSVDIEDCSDICRYPDWTFIQKDDIEFAAEFEAWCRQNKIKPEIDVLFVDTSHLFEHTQQEINGYFPYLSDRAKVFFHDTNLTKIYYRKDGSVSVGWDNERGVIKALEAYFNKEFNEDEPFVDFVSPFLINHNPYCCGLTILKKTGSY
jgi:cephalosporin hydroxylase